MKTEDYKYMINSYFDGELNREKEALLFTYLSQDEECREYFKSMNLLKSSVEKSFEDFPLQLEERILNSAGSVSERNGFFNKNIFAVVSYSLAVILLIFSIMFYRESSSYKEKLDTAIEQVNKQNQILQAVLNSIPSVVVKASEVKNDIIVTPKLWGKKWKEY